MKKEIENILKKLNTNQKNAVTVEKNSVIAAGAGSGKTKVLASRFVYFVVEKEIPVENILALTFTEKAAAEMNKRIYNELKKLEDKNAKNAVQNFHKSKISTLDSFCNSIARLSCKQFGISPDFAIDDDASYRLAEKLSLDFFLRYRANKTMQFFLAENSITGFVQNLFVKLLTQFVFISKPLDFKAGLDSQIEETLFVGKKYLKQSINILTDLLNSDDNGNYTKEVQPAIRDFKTNIGFPDGIEDKIFLKFLDLIKKVSASRKKAKIYDDKEIKALLNEAYNNLLNVYNFEYSKNKLLEFFELLEVLQKEFIEQKKQQGILTFGDVANLAVDSLITNSDLRNFYKKNIQLIMIDEFQDNNSLQRALLFLIAEKLERDNLTVPEAKDLLPNKLFFVGDEKQSIYAFRGADVSVFRNLSNEIATKEQIDATRLLVNYRTEPAIIELFNLIFSKVFYSEVNMPEDNLVPSYEAEYFPTDYRPASENVKAKMSILLIDEKRYSLIEDEEKNNFLSPVETEAFVLAKKILAMHTNKTLVKKDDGAKPCTWSDFAILMKASTKQGVYERIFRQMGIPYKSIQQKGLFVDAPINDLYSILKLLAYPNDKKSYAQVLRSFFVNIDDDSFAILMINFKRAFDSDLSNKLKEEDRKVYLDACQFFKCLQEKALELNSAELITYLWYDKAYRYLLLQKQENHRYLELYDYFFELARKSDLQGNSLSQFVDSMSVYIDDGEKLDNMEIPLEQTYDAVSFLTVHRSKGLEFPIVCIPDCGNKGFVARKDGLVFYNKKFGAVLHTPQVPNLPIQKNMIFESLRDETNKKLIAEVKRVLYVAVTRAESYLIMSSVEKNLREDDEITDKPRKFSQIKSLVKDPENKRSFFDWILPALPSEHPSIDFEEILPQKTTEIFKQKTKINKIDFSELYKKAKVKEFPLAEKTTIAATAIGKTEFEAKPTEEKSLSNNQLKTEIEFFMNNSPDNAEDASREDEFTPVQLGTLAHEAIEARFLNKEFCYPPKVEKKVKTWVNNFFNSDIYKLTKKAKKLKAEYSFLTKYDNQIVSGQIDLVFTVDDVIYIIDYKTDEVEQPAHHKTQLAIYKKAICDLAKMRNDNSIIKTFLFYLKTGNCVEI